MVDLWKSKVAGAGDTPAVPSGEDICRGKPARHEYFIMHSVSLESSQDSKLTVLRPSHATKRHALL